MNDSTTEYLQAALKREGCKAKLRKYLQRARRQFVTKQFYLLFFPK